MAAQWQRNGSGMAAPQTEAEAVASRRARAPRQPFCTAMPNGVGAGQRVYQSRLMRLAMK